MPPLAQTKPCGVSVMITPLRHPDDPPRLAQDDLDLARIAVAALGELDRLGPRLDRRQVDDRALGLRHDLLGDDERRRRRGAAAAPASRRARRR